MSEGTAPPGHPGIEDADRPVELGSGRIEAFSDAVIAVIMTLMALGIDAPEGASYAALRARFPSLLVYALSFAFVGIYWNNHHHLLRATRRISGTVMWSNLFLLFWLSLIPVCTKWISSQYEFAAPVAAYGVVCLACALAYSILVRSLIRANGADSAVAQAVASDRKGYASLALYSIGVATAFLSPYISFVLYGAVSVMWFIPDRRFVRPPSK